MYLNSAGDTVWTNWILFRVLVKSRVPPKCEGVSIKDHSKPIQESFQSLTDHKDEDPQRMHALLARISDGLA